MTSPLMITVSGLRGVIGETLSPLEAMRYAAAFAASLPAGSVVITRDSRASGEIFARAISAALNALGRDTLDAGIAATPTTGVLVREYGAAGGIQISASHNPSEYNGMKLFSRAGRVIPASSGEKVLAYYQSLSQNEPFAWVTHEKLGSEKLKGAQLNSAQHAENVFVKHIESILASVNVDAIRQRRFRVLLDANHGAGGAAGRFLLETLGCEVTILGETADGNFAHTPEPTEENLQEVAARVAQISGARSAFDLAFCQDPDADRLALLDETGRYIGEEYTVPLCVEQALRTRGSGTIVINCATSRMTEDVAQKYGATVVRSAVGEANVVDAMLAHNAIFGGEGNGGPIDPQIGLVRDSFVGMAMVLDSLSASGETLSQKVATLPQYAMLKEKITLDANRVSAALDAVEEKLGSSACVSRLDGLRIDFHDQANSANNAWVLLRASNTEPIVRIIAEAATCEAVKNLCDNVKKIIAEL